MGVTYKLTDEIVHYIIEQKQQNPDFSLRELGELVSSHFQVPVSKSSIHDVLKEAHITSPRGRKVKNKFEIPAAKKAQLLADLPEIAPPKPKELPPKNAAEAKPRPDYRQFVKQMDFLKPLEPDGMEALSEFLLKASFYDLFPPPHTHIDYQDYKVLPHKDLEKEILYRATAVGWFEIKLRDGTVFYIDARFKALSLEPPAQNIAVPIERALSHLTGRLCGAAEPIMLQVFRAGNAIDPVRCLWEMMEGKRDRGIAHVAVASPQGSTVAEFNTLPVKSNTFILGLDTKAIDFNSFTNETDLPSAHARSHCFSSPLAFTPLDQRWEFGGLRTIRWQDTLLVSNAPDAVADGALVRQYVERNGTGGPEDGPPFAPIDPLTQAEDPILDHLLNNLLGKRFPRLGWPSLSALAGERRSNDHYRILDVPLEVDHPLADALKAALQILNALALQDGQGRLLHVVISDKKCQ